MKIKSRRTVLVLLHTTAIKFRGFKTAENAFFPIPSDVVQREDGNALTSVLLNMTGLWPQSERFYDLEKLLLQRGD